MTTGLSGTREEERSEVTVDTSESRTDGVRAAAPGGRDAASDPTLGALLQNVVATKNSAQIDSLKISQVACDSRKVRPGAFFFALHGAKADGNAFLQNAIANGAAAIASAAARPSVLPENV